MTARELRRLCLRLEGATEEHPFGPETTVFKVGGKMFVVTGFNAPQLKVTLKCDPELSERLRASYPAIVPGYHANKRHWITVTLDGSVPDDTVRALIEDSYDLVRPRRRR